MTEPDPFRYDAEIDESAQDSHGAMLTLVGRDKRVLEVGCSTGAMTRVLVEHGCSVVGMEADPITAEKAREFAERVIVGDVEALDLWRKSETIDSMSWSSVTCSSTSATRCRSSARVSPCWLSAGTPSSRFPMSLTVTCACRCSTASSATDRSDSSMRRICDSSLASRSSSSFTTADSSR